MKGIEANTKTPLITINKKINDWMKLNIKNYNATQWGEIIKHPAENKYLLIVNDDSRKPLLRLTTDEKNKIKAVKELEWKPMIEQ